MDPLGDKEDPNHILLLIAGGSQSSWAFAVEQNQSRYIPPPPVEGVLVYDDREDTPFDYETTETSRRPSKVQEGRILLTFDRPPKNPSQGYVFGSMSDCDVFIGTRSNKVASKHFAIFFDDEKRVVLQCVGAKPMSVDQDGYGVAQDRLNFTWILFEASNNITVQVGDCDQITIQLCKHTGCHQEYEAQIDNFRLSARSCLPELDGLAVRRSCDTSATQSQAGSVFQDVIFVRQELVGQGGFGEVYKATNVSTGEIVALKKFKDPEDDRRAFKKELHNLENCPPHDHIVKFLGHTFESNKPCYYMEYLPLGDLLYQAGRQPIVDKELAQIGHQVSQALTELHAINLAHRDLKPGNILVSRRTPDEIFVKIADFGLAKIGSLASRLGTQQYMAPEMFSGSGSYDKNVDVWALAVIMVQFGELKGNIPSRKVSLRECWRYYHKAVEKWRLGRPSLLADLVYSSMLIDEPQDRASAAYCEERFAKFVEYSASRHHSSPAPEASVVSPSANKSWHSSSSINTAKVNELCGLIWGTEHEPSLEGRKREASPEDRTSKRRTSVVSARPDQSQRTIKPPPTQGQDSPVTQIQLLQMPQAARSQASQPSPSRTSRASHSSSSQRVWDEADGEQDPASDGRDIAQPQSYAATNDEICPVSDYYPRSSYLARADPPKQSEPSSGKPGKAYGNPSSWKLTWDQE